MSAAFLRLFMGEFSDDANSKLEMVTRARFERATPSFGGSVRRNAYPLDIVSLF
jgi:hypothetical protein